MDQISPPMRIVLAVAVVFLAAYMLVLRPKDEEAAPAPTPVTAPAADAGGAEAGTSLGKAVEGAREAAGATEAAQNARSGETEANAPSTTQSTPSTPAPAAEKAEKPVEDKALADLPDWLRKSIDKKVVAFLFTNGESADDRRTSRALQGAYTGDNDVVTRVVNVKKVAQYQAVAEDLDVSQSPTLLVIARDRTARAFPGFSSRNTINQAIIDALLATKNPVENVPFLKTAQSEGRQIHTRDIVGVTEGTTGAEARKNINSTLDVMQSSLGTLRNAPVPAAYRDVKGQLTRFLASEISVYERIVGAIDGNDIDLIAVRDAYRSNRKLRSRTLLELNAVGVSSFN